MAYDEGLAERIREVLQQTPGLGEKKMFGGICFTLGGHMMVGIVKEALMVRLGEAAARAALARPGARPMDFTGKPMKDYLFVDPIGIAEDPDLAAWIALAQDFVAALPAKAEAAPTSAKSAQSTRTVKPAPPAKSAQARARASQAAGAGRVPAGKVLVENPNVPGYTQTVDATMYADMKRVLLALLPARAPGLTQTDIRSAIVARLSPALYPGGAKADWWSKLVQLDLEAKGQVVREAGKPLRWHRAHA